MGYVVLEIAEIFRSIQGESTRAGLPCAFIRLAGCNLSCRYCDTPQARDRGEQMTIGQVLESIDRFPNRLVEITGGEPLLQEGVHDLIAALLDQGREVLLETNGSVPIEIVDPRVVKIVDMKCPGSGMTAHMCMENLSALRETDEVKFVVADEADYLWSRELIEEHGIAGRAAILLSPVHGVLESAALAAWMLRDSLEARFQIQLHKAIWGDGPEGLLDL